MKNQLCIVPPSLCIANRGIRVCQWPADAGVPSHRADTEMDLLVGVLLLFLGAGVRAHTNPEPLKERGGRSIFRHFEEEFEPYAFAAVPLHQPLPIIRVLSPPPKYKFGTPYDDMESFNYFSHQPIYSASMIDPRVTEPSESSSEQQYDVIYAKPSKRGGYTYRKQAGSRPEGFRPLRSHPPPEPVILRVHKYKIVRNR